MSISKDVIKQCLISKQREVDEQGGAATGEVCQGARGLEVPADYV